MICERKLCVCDVNIQYYVTVVRKGEQIQIRRMCFAWATSTVVQKGIRGRGTSIKTEQCGGLPGGLSCPFWFYAGCSNFQNFSVALLQFGNSDTIFSVRMLSIHLMNHRPPFHTQRRRRNGGLPHNHSHSSRMIKKDGKNAPPRIDSFSKSPHPC
jgi:hypothetical protein